MFYTFSHIDNKLFSKLPDFSVILSTTITSIEYVSKILYSYLV